MNEEWCDICEKTDCYHLSDAEKAHKALDKNISHDLLDNWICQHCPNKSNGDLVCKPDCKTCGGVGLVRLTMRDLKVYSRVKQEETLHKRGAEHPVHFFCPLCDKPLILKMQISTIELSLESKNTFHCPSCKSNFNAYVVP